MKIYFIVYLIFFKTVLAINYPNIDFIKEHYQTELKSIVDCESFDEFIHNDSYYIPWENNFIFIHQLIKELYYIIIKEPHQFKILKYTPLISEWEDKDRIYEKCDDSTLYLSDSTKLKLHTLVFNQFVRPLKIDASGRQLSQPEFKIQQASQHTYQEPKPQSDGKLNQSSKNNEPIYLDETLPYVSTSKIINFLQKTVKLIFYDSPLKIFYQDNLLEPYVIKEVNDDFINKNLIEDKLLIFTDLNNTVYALVRDMQINTKFILYIFVEKFWFLYRNETYTYNTIQEEKQILGKEKSIIFKSKVKTVKFNINSLQFYRLPIAPHLHKSYAQSLQDKTTIITQTQEHLTKKTSLDLKAQDVVKKKVIYQEASTEVVTAKSPTLIHQTSQTKRLLNLLEQFVIVWDNDKVIITRHNDFFLESEYLSFSSIDSVINNIDRFIKGENEIMFFSTMFIANDKTSKKLFAIVKYKVTGLKPIYKLYFYNTEEKKWITSFRHQEFIFKAVMKKEKNSDNYLLFIELSDKKSHRLIIKVYFKDTKFLVLSKQTEV